MRKPLVVGARAGNRPAGVRALLRVTVVPEAGGPPEVLEFWLLTRWRDRLKGLLGTRRGEDACAVALAPCASVHTFGMRFPIDVALVARDGRVLEAREDVPPGRLVCARGATYALERPSEGDLWPRAGSRVWVTHTEGVRR